jgi:hypothetical protein
MTTSAKMKTQADLDREQGDRARAHGNLTEAKLCYEAAEAWEARTAERARRCRFDVGIEGRKCGRVGRTDSGMIDGNGNAILFCLEHNALLHDPVAVRELSIERHKQSRAARRGRRLGQSKLAYRAEMESKKAGLK